jgi:hypothetical protein
MRAADDVKEGTPLDEYLNYIMLDSAPLFAAADTACGTWIRLE